jgi:apolipoprotein N-acyltransferase
VGNGAQLIFIITNDGWWGDTPGHRQHYSYASLRAIETRRCVARSANTGISAFINQRGDILQRTKYWEPDVIKASLTLNNTKTFYVRYGDYLGRLAMLLSAGFLLLNFVIKYKDKRLKS